MNFKGFLNELKRRNVFRVATAYAIAGWLIIQIVSTIAPQLGFPEWIPSFITVLVLSCFPIAIIVAWAFELTPDGIKKSAEVDITKSVTAATSKKLNGLIIGTLSLLVIFLLFERFLIAPDSFAQEFATSGVSNQISEASVAVLPFVDLSPEGDQEYFSDGISEEILNVLVKVNDLEVASRTSSFQFKGRELGIPEIAEELKVKHVLEGSVRKSGNTVRVTAQLIEAKTDKHLWSETYDRPLTTDNIFDIQDEISKAIVGEMGSLIGSFKIESPGVTKTTDNLDAYELYLKARPYFLDRSRLDEANELLVRAIELDPEYADAWEMRAAIQSLLNSYGYSDLDLDVLHEKGLEYANRTLELNPNSSLATATIGNIYFDRTQRNNLENTIEDAIQHYDKALELDPRNASAILWKGIALLVTGKTGLAEESFELCLQLEPRYAPCYENYIVVQSLNGNDEEALEIHNEGLNQGLIKVKYSNFGMLARMGQEMAFKSATNDPDLLLGWNRHDELWQAFQNIDNDHTELGRDVLNFIEGKSGIDEGAISMLVYSLGVYDVPIFPFLIWDPSYSKFRQTKQFKEYITKSGIFDYWKNNSFPDRCKPVGMNDFECS